MNPINRESFLPQKFYCLICFHRVYVVFGNVIQDYDRASSEDIMTVMETCRPIINVNLSNLPLRYESTQQFSIDWCKMNVSLVELCTTE